MSGGERAENWPRVGVVYRAVPGAGWEARAPDTFTLSQAHPIQKTLGTSCKNVPVGKESVEDGGKTEAPERRDADELHEEPPSKV